MRILVLGGTRFAGRAIVDAALGRGDTVTMFNRGQSNPGLYPGVETVTGDRTADLSALDGREFDAVVDVVVPGRRDGLVSDSFTRQCHRGALRQARQAAISECASQ